MKPNYKQIYTDILAEKYPGKIEDEMIKSKIKHANSVMDILYLNKLIFGGRNKETEAVNQRLRTYDQKSIMQILDYQKINDLNNTQVANHFQLSRNTLAKWKKIFGRMV